MNSEDFDTCINIATEASHMADSILANFVIGIETRSGHRFWSAKGEHLCQAVLKRRIIIRTSDILYNVLGTVKTEETEENQGIESEGQPPADVGRELLFQVDIDLKKETDSTDAAYGSFSAGQILELESCDSLSNEEETLPVEDLVSDLKKDPDSIGSLFPDLVPKRWDDENKNSMEVISVKERDVLNHKSRDSYSNEEEAQPWDSEEFKHYLESEESMTVPKFTTEEILALGNEYNVGLDQNGHMQIPPPKQTDNGLKRKKSTGERPHKCTICFKTFSRKHYLLKHSLDHHKVKPLLKKHSDLEKYIHLQTGDKPHRCSICDKSFSRKSNLLQHIAGHVGNNALPFTCDLCDKQFVNNCELKRHFQTHTGEKPYNCSICDKSFYRETMLKQHILGHNGNKPLECKQCPKTFSYNSGLSRHMLSHTKERAFSCSLCDRRFQRNSELNRHEKSHTGTEKKKFRCQACNKEFCYMSAFRRHCRKYTKEKLFECEICHKKLGSSTALSNHQIFHRKRKCEMCDESFLNVKDLRVHREKAHPSDRKFSCSFCFKSFYTESVLIKHLRIHTVEKKFDCKKCGKRFLESASLERHRSVHLSEKHFQCPECLNKFSHMDGLRRHQTKNYCKGQIRKNLNI